MLWGFKFVNIWESFRKANDVGLGLVSTDTDSGMVVFLQVDGNANAEFRTRT